MQDIDIGQITEALNDKMDLDSVNANPAVAKQSDLATLQNTVSQLQATVTSLQGAISDMLGRIDYSNSITGTMATNTTYTIPSNGYIRLTKSGSSTSGYYYVRVNGVDVTARTASSASPSYSTAAISYGDLLAVSAGDIITNKGDSSGPTLTYTFFPQKTN